jgi:hypothetical protein
LCATFSTTELASRTGRIKSVDEAVALLDKSTEEMMSHFILDDYNPHPAIQFKVAV